MKYVSLLLGIFLFMMFACTTDQTSLDIEKQVAALTTDEEKLHFIQEVQRTDQEVRGAEGSDIMIEHGHTSKAYKAWVERQWETDQVNLEKMEAYVSTHGIPQNALGKEVAYALWIVVHHAQDLASRSRNFEYIYLAYLDDQLDDGELTMYLERMYNIKFRKRFDPTGMTTDESIHHVIHALGLDEKKKQVLADRQGGEGMIRNEP